MSYGKTIKIFLLEGVPNGVQICELSNWTGKAYRIPRISLDKCADRSDLKAAGVYLLFGRTENGRDLLYIGEAESVFDRLKQHIVQKEFWIECIAFVSRGENLNKAHIKYLENRLYDRAKQIGRCELENNNTPTQSMIAESERAEMNEFMDNLILMVGTLGHKVFEPQLESATDVSKRQPIVFVKGTRNAKASGQRTSEGFLVLKESVASKETTNSFPKSLIAFRQNLIETGKLEETNEGLFFKDDVLFGSPSTAAMVIFGRPSNGLEEWKNEQGITLKKIEQGAES